MKILLDNCTFHDCRFIKRYCVQAFNLLFHLRVNLQRPTLYMYIDIDEMPELKFTFLEIKFTVS